ncbi:hypothetical protein [Dactylosporangium darangshiense]|uniref:hypothetical protein n=1 Tax=Dactylosporangium darangshiense TaxID=579108 RepID=UPI003629ED06
MIEDTLRRYARQDLPPSGLQAADVLVEARRRNRRRARLVGAAAGAAVLATFGAAAVVRTVATTPITAAGTGCVVEQLDIPAGTTGGVVANGIDPSGRYVIGLAGTRAAPQAVLWTGGTVRVLPGAFAPQAVNAAGLVVGFTGPTRVQYGDEKHQRPAVYDGTRLVPLPLPDGGLGGVAYAVNTHGDVLGTVVRADGSSAAVRWRTTGTVAIVSTVAGASGLGLNDDGVAVGFGVPLPTRCAGPRTASRPRCRYRPGRTPPPRWLPRVTGRSATQSCPRPATRMT